MSNETYDRNLTPSSEVDTEQNSEGTVSAITEPNVEKEPVTIKKPQFKSRLIAQTTSTKSRLRKKNAEKGVNVLRRKVIKRHNVEESIGDYRPYKSHTSQIKTTHPTSIERSPSFSAAHVQQAEVVVGPHFQRLSIPLPHSPNLLATYSHPMEREMPNAAYQVLPVPGQPFMLPVQSSSYNVGNVYETGQHK